MRTRIPTPWTFSLLTLSLLALMRPAFADETEDRRELTAPDSSVSVGVGSINRDNGRLGQYLGLHERGSYGLIDILSVKRDDATGTWLRLDVRNLGLTSRDVRIDHYRQGDWGYFLQWNEIPRASQYTINTRLAGIGTGTQVVSGEPAMRDVRLDTLRQAVLLGFDKHFGNGYDAQLRMKSEDKSGSRLFGRSSGDFLAEPIDSTISQIEATLGYVGKSFQWSAGYNGTRYDNHVTALFATGGAGASFSPIALPPGNHGHQFHISGAYAFTSSTRAHAKLSWGRFTQDDAFIAVPTANPNLTGKTQLDGRIDTRLFAAGLSSRLMPTLSVNANIRIEDRDDKTPAVRYGAAPAAGSTFDGLYEPRSIGTRFAKLEGTYRLPAGLSLVAALEQDDKERFVPPGPVVTVAAREKSEETTWKLEVRRAMSESLNGTIAWHKSERDGSPLLTSTGFISGLPTSNLVAPFHVADRERDKRKLTLDWTPTEVLSFQFVGEDSDDQYSGRPMGLREGSSRTVSIDASLALAEAWQVTAWASRSTTSGMQVTQTCNTTAANVCTGVGQVWTATLGNVGNAAGVSLRGQFKSGLELGADVQRTKDRADFDIQATYPTGVTPPPTSNYSVSRLKLFGRTAISKQMSVRAEVTHERWSTDDWTWANWAFADGTRVLQSPRQAITFLGVAVQYRF